jgi:hypothetical protein
MITGFDEIDRIISPDRMVEFYSTDREILWLFYHRVIVLSSPIKVVIVGERGGIDPELIRRFREIFNVKGEIYIRRAFKAEDVKPTIEAMNEDMILVDPYHHRKLYGEIVSAIRNAGRVFIFSFMDREKEGSIFGLHSAHSLIRLERRSNKSFSFKIIKSVNTDEVEIPYSIWELFGKSKGEGLLTFLV